MQKFRVFNHVSRVGVEWNIGDTRFQIPSMTLMMTTCLVTVTCTTLAASAGGPFLTAVAVFTALLGLVLLAVILKTVLQMNNMGRLRESTQLRLLIGSAAVPVYQNFATPDFADGDNEYRNF